MGKYIASGEVYRINFPDGQWVDIKEELSQLDQDYIINQMAIAGANQTDGKIDTKVSLNLGKQPLLERSIIDWSFADDDKKIPITSENIANLRVKYRDKVLKEIDRLNKEAQEFLKN